MFSNQEIDTLLQNGIFFVTICARKREPLFSLDDANPYQLSNEGFIAKHCWLSIPDHFPNVRLDASIVMPDHIHGIVGFLEKRSFQIEKFARPVKKSMSTVVRSYKSAVTKAINELSTYQDYRVWQPSFYKHRIESKKEFYAIRNYIKENPYKWITQNHGIF